MKVLLASKQGKEPLEASYRHLMETPPHGSLQAAEGGVQDDFGERSEEDRIKDLVTRKCAGIGDTANFRLG